MTTTKWTLDPTHAEIQFKIRHMMVSTVTGSFGKFDATIETTDDNFETAKIAFSAEVDSITTNNAQRDGHLKSADFFEREKFPTLDFKSTKFEKVSGEQYTLYGDLTLRGVTKNIKLSVDHGGVVKDPYGFTRTGFSLEGKIDRRDFNVSYNGPLENGGLILGEEVKIHANVEFTKQA